MYSSVSARRWFLRTALAYLGTPYRWGGDDPSGFDCSGFVIECLKSVGLLDKREDFTADGLMRRLADQEIADPRLGALLFRVKPGGRAEHVAICLDTCFEIGASGGGRQTDERVEAWRENAYVKIRPIGGQSGRRRICDPFLTP